MLRPVIGPSEKISCANFASPTTAVIGDAGKRLPASVPLDALTALEERHDTNGSWNFPYRRIAMPEMRSDPPHKPKGIDKPCDSLFFRLYAWATARRASSLARSSTAMATPACWFNVLVILQSQMRNISTIESSRARWSLTAYALYVLQDVANITPERGQSMVGGRQPEGSVTFVVQETHCYRKVCEHIAWRSLAD